MDTKSTKPNKIYAIASLLLIPVILGLVVTYLLYRRDYVPPKREEDQPWKKFTQRR